MAELLNICICIIFYVCAVCAGNIPDDSNTSKHLESGYKGVFVLVELPEHRNERFNNKVRQSVSTISFLWPTD